MQFKLNFDDKISAALIGKIAQRASGGSLNKALQIMVIEWNAQEEARNRSENDPIAVETRPDTQYLDGQIEAALASIDAEF